MRLPPSYKRIAPGLFWNEKLAKVKVRVARPGNRGRKPWTTTLEAATRNDALAAGYAFRRYVLEHEAKPGEKATPGPFRGMPNFSAYVERYWPIGRLCPKVEKDQKCVVDSSLVPRFGTFPLDKISPGAIADFQTVLLQRMKPISANGHVRVLRKVLRHAHDNDVLQKLPAFPPALRHQRPKLEITDDDTDRLLAAFDAPQTKGGAAGDEWAARLDEQMRWAKPLFVVAVECGLARTDLLGLRWSEIDWKRRLILRRRNKTGQLATPYITDRALAALQECRNRPVVSSEHVFVTPDNKPYGTTALRRYFARAKALAKITGRCRFHDLRHAFATRLANRGLGVLLLQKAGGWANASTAQGYVGDVTAEGLQELARTSER